jgi:hypothetical protein
LDKLPHPCLANSLTASSSFSYRHHQLKHTPSFDLSLCLVLGLVPRFGLILCFGLVPSFGLVLSKWKNKVDAQPTPHPKPSHRTWLLLRTCRKYLHTPTLLKTNAQACLFNVMFSCSQPKRFTLKHILLVIPTAKP